MDRGSWQVQSIALQRVRHDLATKPPQTMYNTDNQQGHSVQHRKFGSIFWDKLCEKKNLIKSDYVYTYNWITLLYT